MLDVSDCIVAGIPDSSAAETRKAGKIGSEIGTRHLLQNSQGIGNFSLNPGFRSVTRARPVAVSLKDPEWPGSQKAVPANPLTANKTFKQERPFPLLNFAK